MTSVPSDRPINNAMPEAPRGRKIWCVGTLIYTTGGLVLLSVWLLGGDFALAVRDRAVPPVMQDLFKTFGASDFVTGLIFVSIPAALGLMISPVVAYNSDRFRSRWGRRIPFMIVPVPFIVFATMGLAYTPQLAHVLAGVLGRWSPGFNSSALIVMSICWIVFEICVIVTYSVFGALMNDVVPQAVLGRFFGFFRAISLLAGIAFFYNVMGNALSHFTLIFLVVGLIYGVAFTLMCLMVKEGEPPPVVDEPVALPGGLIKPRPGIFTAVITYFRDGFGNTYYLWFFASVVLCGMSGIPFNLYALYYSKSIGMSDGDYGKCIALSYTISLLLCYPIGWAADRFHPLRLTAVLLALYAVIMVDAGILVHDAWTFGIALVLHTVSSGSISTAWASLTQRLLPRARFAEINSAGGIVGSLAGMIFIPLLGKLLDLLHHDYRCTFYMSAGITSLAFGAFLVLHARFMKLGGPKNYVAPE